MNHCAKLSVIVIAVLVLSSTNAASLSSAQGTTPQVAKLYEETSYYLKAVTFIDASTGWAVGDVHWDQDQRRYTATIIQTTDGGASWTAQPAGVDDPLNGVAFVDAVTGWAVGANGTIVHTADGGQTWERQPVDTTDEFRDVAFVNASTGWAAATVMTAYDDFLERELDWDASLWHTQDGGQSWQQQTLPAEASILHGVEFVDAQTGWAVGTKRAGENAYGNVQHAGVIYHTADGGQTWSEQFSVEFVSLTAADFVDPLNGWVVGFPTNSGEDQRAVFHTTDGGQTWERQEPGDIYAPLWDVHFIDQSRGYIVGANYVAAWGPPVFRTFDGGTTWEPVKMEHANPLSVEGIYGVAVVGDRVIAVGDHDYLATSTRAWDSCEADNMQCLNCTCLFEQAYINPHYIFHSAFFADDMQGWVVGSKTLAVSHWGQVILHTTDGGQTWETQYEHAPDIEGLGGGLFNVHRLADIRFTDAQTGWAVGSSVRFYGEGWEFAGAIVHTTNGGVTWQENTGTLYEGREREFFALTITPNQDLWALATRFTGSSNIHLVHMTGGSGWTWTDTGVDGTLAIGFALVQGDVDFPDDQHGWAVGGLGQIVSTADGGLTWSRQELACPSPGCHMRLFAVEMIDPQTGWIGGEGLYHSTNGGIDWTPQEIELPGDVHDIQFLDDQRGWLAGDRGLLMVTSDGGATWQTVDTYEGTTLNGLHFVSPDRGWIVGDYGVILSVQP